MLVILTKSELSQEKKLQKCQKTNLKDINQQLKLGNIMSKAQSDEKVKTGDLIWVNSYTRDDGTKVCGYYRKK